MVEPRDGERVGRVCKEQREVLALRPRCVPAGRHLDPRPRGIDERDDREAACELTRELRRLDRIRIPERRGRLAGRVRRRVQERHREREPGTALRRRLRLIRDRLQFEPGGDSRVEVREEVHELNRRGREQLRHHVLTVELVVVEPDPSGDDPAGRESTVDVARALLRLECADEAAHRTADREHTTRCVRERVRGRGVDRLELVAHRVLQRPPRPVRVVGRACKGIAPIEQRGGRGRVRRVRRSQRPEAVAVQEQHAVPVARNIGDPGRAVGKRASEVRARGNRGRRARRRRSEREPGCQGHETDEILRRFHIDLPRE